MMPVLSAIAGRLNANETNVGSSSGTGLPELCVHSEPILLMFEHTAICITQKCTVIHWVAAMSMQKQGENIGSPLSLSP